MQEQTDHLARLTAIAREAGAVILDIHARGFSTDAKGDGSPVTEADRRAEDLIVKALNTTFPGAPIIAEEAVAAGHVPTDLADRFFLVDPLDGTREFVAGRPDFTVNIALVENGIPVEGVIFAPAKGELYSGARGVARFSERDADPVTICVRAAPVPPVALASRSHRTPETDRYIRENGITECVSVGSSLKFCWLARGLADVYPRFGRTMEWDTAAGDAILRAAGGMTTTTDGTPLLYGKRADGFANPHFIARSQ